MLVSCHCLLFELRSGMDLLCHGVVSCSSFFPKLTFSLCFTVRCVRVNSYKDWWWKLRVGQCHYRLGLFRDAERQFKSALKDNDTITAYLYLAKVYVRLDQPNAALDLLTTAAERCVFFLFFLLQCVSLSVRCVVVVLLLLFVFTSVCCDVHVLGCLCLLFADSLCSYCLLQTPR